MNFIWNKPFKYRSNSDIHTISKNTDISTIQYESPAEKEIPNSIDVSISSIRYETPNKKDIAVCFAFFNYAKSTRILMNYLYITEKLKAAGIPLYTIELITTSSYEIDDAIHVQSSSYLFQKERLYRLLEPHIPEHYTKLLFLDADIIFHNSSWYSELSTLLDTYEVVQPFEKAFWLDITYKNVVFENHSYVKHVLENITEPGQVGFAWAFQRGWYNKFGFFDYAICGGGDSVSKSLFSGRDDCRKWVSESYHPLFMEQREAIKDSLPNLAYLSGTIYHLWHGSRELRQYITRHKIFTNETDIRHAITINKDGAFEIINQEYNQQMYNYFKSRCDDLV